MTRKSIRLAPREKQIAELLLQGCSNEEIAQQLHIALRTVKAHFNRLFLRFGITGGIKRVKLATLLYRRQMCKTNQTAPPVTENNKLSNSSPKAAPTAELPKPWAFRNMPSKTTLESSTTNLVSGIGSSSRSGTKPAGTKERRA
jgi:Bacterial regulatory proteins, luxR family